MKSEGNSIDALVFGDPHLQGKYIQVVDQFIEQSVEVVKSQTPNFVVVLGDTLHHHERARESCHSRAVKWFQEMSKHTHVYVLIGNHDRPNNSEYLTDKHFFNGLKGHRNIEIVDTVQSIHVEMSGKRYRFVFVPYVPPGRFQDALDTLDVSIEDEPPKAIFAHQEFKGAKMGAIESEHGDEWSDDKPFSGHIHEYQTVGKKIMYVGTPYQTTYAEGTNKGIFLFNFGTSKDNAKRIRLNLRVKKKITVDASEFVNLDAENIKNSDIDLRVDINGKKEELEAVKKSKNYRELKLVNHVKLVLRPIFELKTTESRVEKVSYMKLFYSKLENDDDMKALYSELLRDIQ